MGQQSAEGASSDGFTDVQVIPTFPAMVPTGSITLRILVDADETHTVITVRSQAPDGSLISLDQWPYPSNSSKALQAALERVAELHDHAVSPF